MERFLDAVRSATARLINERRYVAIDDAIDVDVRDEEPRLAELVELEEAIAGSAEARRGVGFSPEENVPAGYAVGFMRRFLSEYRDRAGHLRAVEDDVLEALLGHLRDFADRPTFPAVVVTPIHGLTMTEARLALDEASELVVIGEDRDVRRAFDYTFRFPMSAAEFVRPAEIALRQEVELPRDAAIDFSPAMDRADKLVAALRLAGLSELVPGAHVMAARLPALSLPATHAKAFRMGRGSAARFSIAPPQDLGHRADEVRTLFAKLDASSDATLTFAVRRFNDSDERARDEDVIFDCFSALEALFAGGATSEITYRLALRAAKVLRATTEERVELFKRLKGLYATRSKVVHGGTVPPAKLAADAAEAKELLRAAIIAWLDSGGHASDELDELLLS